MLKNKNPSPISQANNRRSFHISPAGEGEKVEVHATSAVVRRKF